MDSLEWREIGEGVFSAETPHLIATLQLLEDRPGVHYRVAVLRDNGSAALIATGTVDSLQAGMRAAQRMAERTAHDRFAMSWA
jgi:hypothetical protein